MNLRNAIGGSSSSSRRASPERAAAPGTPTESADPTLTRAPKRVGSFGKGLGTALANSMSRATEGFSSKKSTHAGSSVQSPALLSPNPSALDGGAKEYFGAAGGGSGGGGGVAAGGPAVTAATPDPSHLQNFGLRLSELVNQALALTVPIHQSSGGGVASSVAKHAAGRSSIPSIDQIIYEGKKLPSRAKIQELAQTVVAELRYAKAVDAYFLRAASRAAFKALTLFASRMDSLLVPVAKDPSSLIMPTTLKEGVHISPALEYNLGVATLTWILEDALERCIEGEDDDANPSYTEGMPSFVSEILTPVRKRMETTILHVIQPVLNGVKTSISASVMKSTRYPFIPAGSPALTPSISNESPLPPLSPLVVGSSGNSASATASAFSSPKPADMAGLNASTSWLKELQGRLEGSRKLLAPRIEARTSQDGEGWYISVAVHLIWKGLFVLTARPIGGNAGAATATGSKVPVLHVPGIVGAETTNKRHPSPVQLTAALKSVASVGSSKGATGGGVGGGGANSGRATPSGGNVAVGGGESATPGTPTTNGGNFFSSSGAPSKSAIAAANKATMVQVADLQAFQKMALRFCKGFVSDKALAAVAAELSRADAVEEEVEGDQQLQEEDEEDELARQALAEALEALNSTIVVIQAMEFNFAGVRAALDRGPGASTGAAPLDPLQLRALRAIPPLLLLHLAYARLPMSVKVGASADASARAVFISPPPALFGLTWQEYERSIAGFVGGTSWAQAAVQRWDKEVVELWAHLSERKSKAAIRADGGGDGDGDADGDDTLLAAAASAEEDLGTTPTQRRQGGGGASAMAIRQNGQQPQQALSRSVSGASGASGASRMSRTSSSASSSRGADGDLDGTFDANPGAGAGAILDASQATPRAVGVLNGSSNASANGRVNAVPAADAAAPRRPRSSRSRSSRFGLRLGGGSSSKDSRRSDASARSSTSDGGSRRHTPDGSDVDDADAADGLANSVGSLSVPSADKSPPPPSSSGSKTRFWRSSNTGGANAAANGAGTPPVHSSGASNASTSSFRLPSVSRPTFGAKAATATDAQSGGIRSPSATSLHGGGGAAESAALSGEEEAIDVQRAQEAVLFFARVLEWAAWSAGSEYRCAVGAAVGAGGGGSGGERSA